MAIPRSVAPARSSGGPGAPKTFNVACCQSRHAGTAGVHQRAIDVEQVEHGRPWSGLLVLLFRGRFRTFVRHFIVGIRFECFFFLEVVLLHEFTVEEMELALALVLRER